MRWFRKRQKVHIVVPSVEGSLGFPDDPYTDDDYSPDPQVRKAAERKRWEELDPALRHTAVLHLQREIPAEMAVAIRALMEREVDDWATSDMTSEAQRAQITLQYGFYVPTPFHFGPGMGIRNLLREVIKDDELPTGNWDDYYVQALEEAFRAS